LRAETCRSNTALIKWR